jgi:putative transposase
MRGRTRAIQAGPDCFREQQHNKPLEIKDQEMFNKMLEFIHLNPVISAFVIKPEDWKYSSAKDFNGMQGLIDLSYTS